MQRSLYLGDTVYEVIAESNYEVNDCFSSYRNRFLYVS